jgi:hypothetical protein
MDKLILEALKELKVFVKQVEIDSSINHNIFRKSTGICENVKRAVFNNATNKTYRRSYAIVQKLQDHFYNWPKFSGTRTYPVPSTYADVSAGSKYHKVSNMYIGEYGKLRIELIDYLIKQFEDKLNVI